MAGSRKNVPYPLSLLLLCAQKKEMKNILCLWGKEESKREKTDWRKFLIFILIFKKSNFLHSPLNSWQVEGNITQVIGRLQEKCTLPLYLCSSCVHKKGDKEMYCVYEKRECDCVWERDLFKKMYLTPLSLFLLCAQKRR